MQKFQYYGNRVSVPPYAAVPREYRADGPLAYLVQAGLNSIEPWDDESGVIEHLRMPGKWFNLRVVPAKWREVRWDIHRGHKARMRGLSPFIVNERSVRTEYLTLELKGLPDSAIPTRVYTGEDYEAPLPWQKSVDDAEGGIEECIKFWRTHAYVYRPTYVRGNTPFEQMSTVSPEWYI